VNDYDEASSNYSYNSKKYRRSFYSNQSEEIDLVSLRSNLSSESNRLNQYKELLIARQPHFCKIKINKKLHNRSQPDLHPYFHDFESIKPDNSFYSKCISSFRTSLENEFISELVSNVSPNFESILNNDDL
jgi:hypothetical protein